MKPNKRPFELAIAQEKAEVAITLKTGLAGMELRMTPLEAANAALTLAAAAENARAWRAHEVPVTGNVTKMGARR